MKRGGENQAVIALTENEYCELLAEDGLLAHLGGDFELTQMRSTDGNYGFALALTRQLARRVTCCKDFPVVGVDRELQKLCEEYLASVH